jgi:hypothetical protein
MPKTFMRSPRSKKAVFKSKLWQQQRSLNLSYSPDTVQCSSHISSSRSPNDLNVFFLENWDNVLELSWFKSVQILTLSRTIINFWVYTILVWNTISGSSNIDNCFYHCLILISISHLKALFIIFVTIINIINIVVVVVVLLFIIYIVNLPVVRPRSCRVIYYFNTPTLGRRHQSFGRVKFLAPLPGR